MKKNNIQKMPKAGQAGNGTKPHVRRSFKSKLLLKIDSLVAAAKHECTMSGNIDAQRYLKKLRNFIYRNS